MLRLTTLFLALAPVAAIAGTIELGPRPAYLIDQMKDGPLKQKLASCSGLMQKRNDFSIGHRGAALMFPEHTLQSYKAAAVMGAGIVECDVTFTADKALVCRHAQNDLARTTNILGTDLAKKCNESFTPASGDNKASAQCRTSELTLAEFQTLNGKMDAVNPNATSATTYMDGTANWRTDLYASHGTLMTHANSIALLKGLGVKFTPELKSPSVTMPFKGMSQADYAQKMIDEYKSAGIPAKDVWPQSFNLDDILYWIKNEPEFGKQAVYLDDSYNIADWSPQKPQTWAHSMADLKAMGVNFIAPPLWVLLTLENGKIVPSPYAKQAKAAGLNIITWTLERSGPLNNGGGWYFQTIKDATNSDAMYFEVLDVLAKDVGIVGMFSDWPATVTYYANCMGIGKQG